MELDESHRHELHDSLAATLGARPAATLMAHLPPVGWADVATKHDLHELERRIDMRFEQVDRRFEEVDRRFAAVDHRLDGMDRRLERIEGHLVDVDGRFGELRREMTKQTHALLFGLGSLMVALAGVVVAALHFSSG
jgi:hypothetical protein